LIASLPEVESPAVVDEGRAEAQRILSSKSAIAGELFTMEGFGSGSIGGRGGEVIRVTNLKDGGPGSFRAACEAKGARIVVFEAAGVIVLESGLTIANPYITIAGQTAPGDGITLTNGVGNWQPTLTIKTKHVILQHLRFRTGDAMEMPSDLKNCNTDSLALTDGAEHVMIDHVSCSWATDETVQLYGDPKFVTVQNSIIAEALNWGKHPYTRDREQGHGCALLVGSGAGDLTGNVTIYRNVLAHCSRRNPRLVAQLPVDVVRRRIKGDTSASSCSESRRISFLLYILRQHFNTGTEYGEP